MPTPPKKIALLITDLLLGGTPLLLRTLAEQLPAHNVQPTLISLKPFPPKDVSSFNHSSFEFDSSFVIGGGRHSSFPIPIHSLNIHSPRHFPRAIRTLAKFLNQLRPDYFFSMLIHANALATLTMPFLHPRPLFFQSLQTLQEKPAWHWNLQGILAPFADAMIVPSQPILKKISRYGNVKQSIVIPNGIDIDRFANATPIDNPPWPKDAIVLGYLGRFDPVKNIPLLLHAFAKISPTHSPFSLQNPSSSAQITPNHPPKNTKNPPSTSPLRLALIGYGPQEKDLKNLSTSLHLTPNIHFLGPTTTPEKYYKSFSAHILPSSIEGFGLTLVEAMAAGIPIVAADTPVTRSILRPNIDGFLFKPDDESSLILALQSLINRLQNPLIPAPLHPPATARFSAPEMVRKYALFFKNFRG